MIIATNLCKFGSITVSPHFFLAGVSAPWCEVTCVGEGNTAVSMIEK